MCHLAVRNGLLLVSGHPHCSGGLSSEGYCYTDSDSGPYRNSDCNANTNRHTNRYTNGDAHLYAYSCHAS